MRKLLFLLILLLLGINGVFFWKARGGESSSQVCQLTCSLKLSKTNGTLVLPGAFVIM